MDTLQINRVPMFTRSEDSRERPVDPSISRSHEGLKEAILAETQPGFEHSETSFANENAAMHLGSSIQWVRLYQTAPEEPMHISVRRTINPAQEFPKRLQP